MPSSNTAFNAECIDPYPVQFEVIESVESPLPVGILNYEQLWNRSIGQRLYLSIEAQSRDQMGTYNLTVSEISLYSTDFYDRPV